MTHTAATAAPATAGAVGCAPGLAATARLPTDAFTAAPPKGLAATLRTAPSHVAEAAPAVGEAGVEDGSTLVDAVGGIVPRTPLADAVGDASTENVSVALELPALLTTLALLAEPTALARALLAEPAALLALALLPTDELRVAAPVALAELELEGVVVDEGVAAAITTSGSCSRLSVVLALPPAAAPTAAATTTTLPLA